MDRADRSRHPPSNSTRPHDTWAARGGGAGQVAVAATPRPRPGREVKYRTSVAFRTALEDRLKAARQDGVGLARLRKRVVFERLLARLHAVAPDAWVLKGGFALELRLGARARTTKD